MTAPRISAIAAALGTALVLQAEDWPQWLGPRRDAVSIEPGPLLTAPELPQLWKASIGAGCSSFAVSRGRAYTMGHAKGQGKRGMDTVYAFDAATGALLWKHSYDSATCISQDVLFDGPRSTPTVDDNLVFTLGVEGQLFCLDAATGKVIWQKRLTSDLGGVIPCYGYCCSPLAWRDLLILELNAPGATYMALDKKTGAEVWRLGGGQVTCGSPIPTTVDGQDWVVFSGGSVVVGVAPATGRELWRHRTWGHAWVAPTISGNRIFVANASLPRGCGLIQVNDLKPTVVWEDRKKYQTLHCNSVIFEQHIYGVDNTGTDYQGADSKKSSLKCIDLATGRVKWVKEKTGWGNLIVYDQKLMLLRETGELLIIEASPAGCRELSRVPMLSGSTWSPPALSEGRLYCRNRAGDAICVRVRATEAEWRMAQSKPGMAEQEPASARADAGFRTAMTPIRSSTAALLAGPSHMQWPRFRGPGGLGSVPHINGPISWNGKTGQGIAWKSSVPLQGPSSPVVWKERIFLTGANNQQREVYAYDAASGKTLWRKTVRSSADTENTLRKEETKSILAAPTPATDGEFVWAMFGTGDVACFDMSGLEKWTRSLGMPENSYGHSSSLELWDGMLIIQLDQGDGSKARSKLLALDSRSGNTRWECRRTSPACWSSPIVALWNGGAQLIVNGCPTVTAYNPKDGREIWRVRITGGEVVPSPVLASGLILAGSVDGKFAAIRLDGQGDVTQTHIAWSVEEGVPAICSPVSNGELVFLVDSSGIVVCYDLATGKKVWEHEFDAHFQASPTLAGDKLYVLADSGEMFILQAGRQYELLARAELGEGCVASPAFQPGRIYLRGQNNLYCAGGTGSR